MPASEVNQFSGKLGFSIPLYGYSSPSSSLKFSASVDYTSGGININEDPGCVGTGWKLNAGGSIHREIKGLPDDLYRTTPSGANVSGFCYTPAMNSVPCGAQYRSVGRYTNPDSKIGQDSEPDDFYFSFAGLSGSFNIPRGGLYTNGPKVITKPQSNLNFSFLIGNNPWPIKSDIREIDITDDNGVEYTFTALGTTGKMTTRTVADASPNYHYEYDYQFEDYITDWLLTKVKDKNSGEEINLTYEDYYVKTKFPVVVTRYYSDNNPIGPAYVTPPDVYADDRHTEYWGKAARIKTATLPNGDNITFQYDDNLRCDMVNDKALMYVRVNNNGTNEIVYRFDYVYYSGLNEISYAGCTSASEDISLTKWLFLKSVKKIAPIANTAATIADFQYILASDKISATDNKLPVRKTFNTLNRSGLYNHDLWGFYRGEPTQCSTCYCPIGCSNIPVTGYNEIGSLKKIIYPSGGTCEIEYENNKIKKNGADQLSYGIRIKKLTRTDGISTANNIITEYNYVLEDGSSSGFAMDLPPMYYENQMQYSSSTKIFSVSSTMGVVPPVYINGSPVGYARVEEITSLGKVVSDFTGFSDYPPVSPNFQYPFAIKQHIADWAYGLLKKLTVKDNNGNIVKTTENTFSVAINLLSNSEYNSMRTAYKKESDQMVFGLSTDPISCQQSDAYWLFTYDSYAPITGRSELTSAITKDYLKDGSVLVNRMDNEYDPYSFYLRKTISYNSMNEKFEKIIFYPEDYSTSSSTYKLVQKNIKSLPVASITVLTKTDGSKFITGLEKTEFQQMADYSVRPYKIWATKSKSIIAISPAKTTFTPEEDYGDATLKSLTTLSYDKFDNGGKVLQSTAKQMVQSVIWDKDQKVIVAKANAASDDIAFTSFETSDNGNWSYYGNGFYDISAPAGKKVYELKGGYQLISKTGLNPAKTYVVSYWSNSGAYAINAVTTPIVTGTTINGWTYFKHTVSGASTVNVVGTGFIDELRIHPENARMTSITYEPLIGMTSQSGVEGQMMKFTYDAYGRLLNTKDEFGNISKLYCYNSTGAPSSCGEGYIARNFSFIPYVLYNRTCPVGTVSQPINYSVPTGKYISFISQDDAENQAASEALTFGQAAADRNTAACVQSTVYARLSYENVVNYGSSVSGDVVVRFYSDQAGTQAVPVNGLTVNYAEQVNIPYWSQSYSNNYSTVATGTQVVLATGVTFSSEDYECDYGYWPCYTYTNTDDYSLTGSSNYQVIN